MSMPFSMLSAAEPAAAGLSAGWVAPFVVLLAAIATMPFIRKQWWEKWYPAVAIVLAAIASYPYLLSSQPAGRWVEGMQEYVSFIILLGSLFTIAGGIVIRVQRLATPAMNCTLLLMGAVLSNLLGTTGASMLLIRPYLRMN